MKKVMIAFAFAFILLTSFAFVLAESTSMAAQARANIQSAQNNTQQIREQIRDNTEELKQLREELKQNLGERLRANNEMIRARIQNREIEFEANGEEIRLRIQNHTTMTKLNITEELNDNNETILVIQRGNQTREIKIMPDTASETALTRLRLKVCNETNNCTIELKDVGQRNETRHAYEIQVQRHYKLLGLFKAKAENRIQVDAENGEVIQTKKPWWSFLASESDN